MHGSLSEDKHFVAKELIKLNNTTNICLTRLNIILYNPYSLDTCEYLICQIYQSNEKSYTFPVKHTLNMFRHRFSLIFICHHMKYLNIYVLFLL